MRPRIWWERSMKECAEHINRHSRWSGWSEEMGIIGRLYKLSGESCSWERNTVSYFMIKCWRVILMEIGWLTCFKAISRLWLKDADGTTGWSAGVADGTMSAERIIEIIVRQKKWIHRQRFHRKCVTLRRCGACLDRRNYRWYDWSCWVGSLLAHISRYVFWLRYF